MPLIKQQILLKEVGFNVTNNDKNKNYLKQVLKKIYESEYISESNKNKVKESYKNFNLFQNDSYF